MRLYSLNWTFPPTEGESAPLCTRKTKKTEIESAMVSVTGMLLIRGSDMFPNHDVSPLTRSLILAELKQDSW